MNKKILAVICIAVIAVTAFTGCSQKEKAADAKSSTVSSSQVASEADIKPSESTTTGAGKDEVKSTEKSDITHTAKPKKTTDNKTATTKQTAKAAPKQTTSPTTKAEPKTTVTPTTKAMTKATTKATTVKNVSAKEVQAQVNAYIKSKGVTVDSSLNPSNSGWSGEIAGEQVDLNNGYSLRTCKAYVDGEIADWGTDITMYCYYSNETFYICYL